jgi:K+-sensing histidine kinase KdpD
MAPEAAGEPVKPRVRLAHYLWALLAALLTLVVVGLLHTSIGLPAAILLYLVPVILAASRWGRRPAILACLVPVLGHDVLFVEPYGTLTIASPDEALGLVLLLFTALTTGQLADSARRGAEATRAAAAAQRQDELKTALLRAVSHDLRTPLASIKASVSGLRQPGADYSDDDRAELLAEIEEEADRLDRLVSNLLDASRLEAGVLKPRPQAQDLGELIGAVLRRLQPLLDGREVAVEIPDGLPLVACDYAQLDQVVTNLVENAVLHTPAGGSIRLGAARRDGSVEVEVVDQGPGIRAADRERIFRPFERGPTRARGSGLGLTIARGLAEANGGRLWVEAAVGGGARFVVSLPTWNGTRLG